VGGDSREIAEALLIGGGEDKWGERGARFDDVEAELAGKIVAEAGCSHLGDRQAAGGDDENGSTEFAGLGNDVESVVTADFGDVCIAEKGDVGVGCFGDEHVEDVAGGAVAEELAELLFVPRDAVLLDQGEEVGGRVASERGLREVRIFGEEIFRAAVDVGEVAAASAGDEDLLAGARGAFEDGDAVSTAASFDGAHETGGTCSENEGVELAVWRLIHSEIVQAGFRRWGSFLASGPQNGVILSSLGIQQGSPFSSFHRQRQKDGRWRVHRFDISMMPSFSTT